MLQHPSQVMPGRANIQGLQLLESCSFHWIFDGATRRFRRTPRDAAVWSESSEAWTEYHHLEIDEARSCFVVGLDEAGTRSCGPGCTPIPATAADGTEIDR